MVTPRPDIIEVTTQHVEGLTYRPRTAETCEVLKTAFQCGLLINGATAKVSGLQRLTFKHFQISMRFFLTYYARAVNDFKYVAARSPTLKPWKILTDKPKLWIGPLGYWHSTQREPVKELQPWPRLQLADVLTNDAVDSLLLSLFYKHAACFSFIVALGPLVIWLVNICHRQGKID